MKDRILMMGVFLSIFVSMAFGQNMTVKDSDTNVLMQVEDKGTTGALSVSAASADTVEISSMGAAPGKTANKLYNVGGSLYWNGSALGMSGSAGGWTDGGANVHTSTSTDNVGIGTSSPAAKLDIQGTLNVGVDDTGYDVNFYGADGGSRMFWDESKMAFRAGRVTGTEWDDANVGNGSVAFGTSTTASGYWSMAMGVDTEASGGGSMAMGRFTIASGDLSTAMGFHTKAESYYSVAIGTRNVGGGNATDWVETDPLFEIGIGEEDVSGGANAVTVLKNGNVGIGTATPDETLEVTGKVKASQLQVTDSPTAGYVLTADASGNGTWQAGGNFSDGGEAGGADRTLGNTDNYDLGFLTNNQTRLHIQNDGMVGINDTSPTYTLDVAGKVGINDIQVLYLPDQGTFGGTLIVGNGGSSLLHSSSFDGKWNTALGIRALFSNTTGYVNTANGFEALFSNTTGTGNTSSGYGALYTNTTGYDNTAIGYKALYSNNGYANTANGCGALEKNITGIENTASGCLALASNTGGRYNTASGFMALVLNTTGSSNTALGCFADVSTGDLTNATAIGYGAKVNASNKVVIGNSSVTTIGGYAIWSNYSDRRYKENIEYQDNLGLDFIMKLNTVSFNYKDDENKHRRDGLIAQDVEEALKELGIEFSGLIIDDNEQQTQNLSYGLFVLPLINAVKEQQEMIDTQEEIISDLQEQIRRIEMQLELLANR